MCKKIEVDISKQNLHADIVINKFFSDGKIIPVNEDIIIKAKNRFDIGNPPGKDKSYGDMINWLLLLDTVPAKDDLFFVSSDGDFASPINNKLFNTFLLNEWCDLKSSNLFFYTSLSSFFKEHFKDIELKSENKKLNYIAKLYTSPDFASTHSIIFELNKFEIFTPEQVISLFQAAETNDQVGSILSDDDLFRFYTKPLCTESAEVLIRTESPIPI